MRVPIDASSWCLLSMVNCHSHIVTVRGGLDERKGTPHGLIERLLADRHVM
jgi:hypothetical protein